MSIEVTYGLTEQEKQRPYSKYFSWESGPYDTQAWAAYQADTRLLPEQVTTLEQINDLLKPGYLPGELGWCSLPDGTGYVANRIRMPEVEWYMFPWYLCWFGFENLRYKIWWPPTHFGVELPEQSRVQILSQAPCHEKLFHTSREIVEDMGFGPELIRLTYLSPADMGFDLEQFHLPNIGYASASYGTFLERDGLPSVLCHCMRPHPEGGSELRTRCWFGWSIRDGKPYKAIPEGVRIPDEAMKAFWHHNIQEFSRFRDLIPLLYREYADTPLEP